MRARATEATNVECFNLAPNRIEFVHVLLMATPFRAHPEAVGRFLAGQRSISKPTSPSLFCEGLLQGTL